MITEKVSRDSHEHQLYTRIIQTLSWARGAGGIVATQGQIGTLVLSVYGTPGSHGLIHPAPAQHLFARTAAAW